ncbi:MAG: exopolysaccharide biosynthesis protein [Pseudomonas sp.]|nr:MAG: exopolysaccharide biosynthesis protein [Pseudomonas sp.]
MTIETPGPLERATRIWPIETAPKDTSAEGPIALLKLSMAVAWLHKGLLLACMLVGMLAANLYARSLPRVYNAAATVLLEPRHFAGLSSSAQQNLDLNSAESELQIILSERLLAGVFESLRLADSPELGPQPSNALKSVLVGWSSTLWSLIANSVGSAATPPQLSADPAEHIATNAAESFRRTAFANFERHVAARRVGQSYVVEIEYSSSDPDLPARVANAVLSGYILQSVASKEEFARAGTETLQGRLTALAAQVDAAKQAMREGTLPNIATPDADAKITGAALPPLGPSGPRTSLITALGGMLGLLGSMAAIAIRMGFDQKIRSPRDLLKITSLPCLATIPETGGLTDIGWRGDLHAGRNYAAAVRDLRTSIGLVCSLTKGGKNNIIAFAGYSKEAGMGALSISLAQMLSRSGRTVTLFRSEPAKEETSAAPISLADVAILGRPADKVVYEDRNGIAVMPIHSRDPRANIFCDFRHPNIHIIIEAARSRGDVIFDLPALDTSLDGLALAVHADAVLLVARAGRTTTEEIKDAEQQFRRAGANIVGTVINKVKT